jgi:alpha-tubulin suppressor-like RCC1 family protein
MIKRFIAIFLAAVTILSLGMTAQAKTLTIGNPVDGNLHTLAVKSDGTLWGWGLNLYGELGLGSTKNQLEPQKITDNVVSVSTGSRHSIILKADGIVYTSGANDYGQLGSGDKKNSSTFKQVLSNSVEIAAGETTSFAVKSDGTLWAWGDNQYGMLGDGTTTHKYEPVVIMDSVAHVYPGSFHTLALKTDGTLWVWGQNLDDQMGTGTLGKDLLNYSATPIKLMDNVKSAAAGGKHSLVIKIDGSLWAFGDNYEGELGNGTITDSPKPTQVGSGFVQIAAGYEFSAGIKADGTLWTWGGNTFGQLGDGSFDYKTTPQAVLQNVAAVSAAPYGLRVVKTDGTLWSCGTNAYGEVGTGKTGDVEVLSKVLSGVAIPSGTAGNQTTADEPSTWAAEGVSEAIELGLVPKDLQLQYTTKITRAEFCKLLVAILEKRTGQTADKLLTAAECYIDTGKFTDTSDTDVLTINALGVVNGKGGGLFDPKGYITRQEAATMLYRLGDMLGRTIVPDSKGYADSAQIAAWAQEAVDFIAAAYDGKSITPVMQGVSGNRFDPNGYFTREQAILTALRAFNARGFGHAVLRVDYVNRRVVNYDAAVMEYACDDHSYKSDLQLNQTGGLDTLLSPETHNLWIRFKATDGEPAAQPVYIVLKAIPAVPSQPFLNAGTEPFTSKLINVSTAMEYRTQADPTWRACGGSTVDNLEVSVYDWIEVRTRAVPFSSFASASQVLYVNIGSMNLLTEDDLLSVVNTATDPGQLAAILDINQMMLGLDDSYRLEWEVIGQVREMEVASQLIFSKPEGGYIDFAAFIEAYINRLDIQYALYHMTSFLVDHDVTKYEFSAGLEHFSEFFSPTMTASIKGSPQTGEYADLTKNEKELLAYYVCTEVLYSKINGSSQLEECFVYALNQVNNGACGVEEGSPYAQRDFVDNAWLSAHDDYSIVLFKDVAPDSLNMEDAAIYMMPSVVFSLRDGVTVRLTSAAFEGYGTVIVENGAFWDVRTDTGSVQFGGHMTVNDSAQAAPVVVITRYDDPEDTSMYYSWDPASVLECQQFRARTGDETPVTVTLNTEYHWTTALTLPEHLTIVVGGHRILTMDSLYSILNGPLLGQPEARLVIKQLPGGAGFWELTKFYDVNGRLATPYEGKTYVWSTNPDGGADTADDDGWLMQP